jgi:hypothetical protein
MARKTRKSDRPEALKIRRVKPEPVEKAVLRIKAKPRPPVKKTVLRIKAKREE